MFFEAGGETLAEPGDLRDGAFVIVDKSDSILLVKHGYGQELWSLPGGGVKQGEIVIQAARRELAEETGISQVATMRQVGQFTLMKRYGLVVLFHAMGWSGRVQVDGKEIMEHKFFTFENLNMFRRVIYPAQLKLIEIFLKYPNYPRPIYGKLTEPPTLEFESEQ